MPDVFGLKPRGAGPIGRRAVDFVWPYLYRLLGLEPLAHVHETRPHGSAGAEFAEWALGDLGIGFETDRNDLERFPESGPVVVVANHPFGGAEGLVMSALLRRRRPDVKILANHFLGRIPALRDQFLLIDPFETPEAVRTNIIGLRKALAWLAGGGALVVFPAGEVSSYSLRRRRIEDPPWMATVARLVRRARCPVVPVYFSGRNRWRFQLAGLVHPRLRTLMLAREMLARRGSTIEARLGTAIPFRQLDACGSDPEMVAYLRSRTYILSERQPLHNEPVQPRVTPGQVAPIAAAQPVEVLIDELERLPGEQLLVDGDDQVVYYATANQIPSLMREIGRLREMSFREVGEGTGREFDLDRFDPVYFQLFIWSRANREIVGAYRLGMTDRLIADGGVDGLYTSTLFDYKSRLFEGMGPALEMGRSFIRPEYQKSYQGLMLLWKGIGQFVLRNPRYATLFGPVSISADYRSASQRLIVAFLEQNKYAHEWAQWVRPQTPTRVDHTPSYPLSPAHLKNLDDVSGFIADIEADHKGVPILLKQYLKLGGRLLGFNVDPEFANVLDVLIMVDLRQTKPKTLARYMGREGAASFLSRHAETRAS